MYFSQLLFSYSLPWIISLDLNEKRPAQENEYPYNGNLYSSGIFDNCIGDDESECPFFQF